MIGRSKLLVSKEIRIQPQTVLYTITSSNSPLTQCGYAIVERIAMSQRKASETLLRKTKKSNQTFDFVYHQSASTQKVGKITTTEIGKQPIYPFFINCDWNYFPLRCILDLGSTSFVLCPDAAMALAIPVIKWTKTIKSADVNGRMIGQLIRMIMLLKL